jgi:hypothetical protein
VVVVVSIVVPVTFSVGFVVAESAPVCGETVLLSDPEFCVQLLGAPESSSQIISYRTSIVILLRAGLAVTLETCEE